MRLSRGEIHVVGLTLLFVSAIVTFIAACWIYDGVRSLCRQFWRQERRINQIRQRRAA